MAVPRLRGCKVLPPVVLGLWGFRDWGFSLNPPNQKKRHYTNPSHSKHLVQPGNSGVWVFRTRRPSFLAPCIPETPISLNYKEYALSLARVSIIV